MIRVLPACLVLVLAFLPWASVCAQDPPSTVISPLATLGRLTVALFFVLIVFWVFAKLMKKLQVGQGATSNGLSVVGALPLGQREKIVVVQVGSEQILLGVTSSNISMLHTLGKPLSTDEVSELGDFKQKLSAALQRQVKNR